MKFSVKSQCFFLSVLTRKILKVGIFCQIVMIILIFTKYSKIILPKKIILCRNETFRAIFKHSASKQCIKYQTLRLVLTILKESLFLLSCLDDVDKRLLSFSLDAECNDPWDADRLCFKLSEVSLSSRSSLGATSSVSKVSPLNF